MNFTGKKITNKIIGGLLSVAMVSGIIPTFAPSLQTVSYAEQSSSGDYKDRVEAWIPANSRANEFDVNAVRTLESNTNVL